jgi:hypothetical protein
MDKYRGQQSDKPHAINDLQICAGLEHARGFQAASLIGLLAGGAGCADPAQRPTNVGSLRPNRTSAPSFPPRSRNAQAQSSSRTFIVRNGDDFSTERQVERRRGQSPRSPGLRYTAAQS